MLNHNQNLFLIVSYCFCSFGEFQKFSKGKSDTYTSSSFAYCSACTIKSETVFSDCQQILTKICFVVFCAEMLQQF